MEKKQITDEMLYKVMPVFEEKVLNAMQAEEEYDYQFSDKFQQKMQRLIKRERQKRKYGIPVQTWRRIAAMLAIVLAGLFATTMSVDAVREKVFDFIRTIYETYTSTHYYSQEEIVGEFKPLYPAYVPEGYELMIEKTGEEYLIISYETEEKESIVIQQDQIYDGMEVQNDNEYIKEETCDIWGVTGSLSYKEDGVIRISWEKDGCLYMASATDLTKEELMKVCESLK